MNRNKEIIIGIIVGFIANALGTLGYVALFSKMGISETFQMAIENDRMGSLLALGAILNLVAFFGFLKIHRDHRAKGVLIATLVTALVILGFKFF